MTTVRLTRNEKFVARKSHDPPLLPHYPLGSAMWGRGRQSESLLLYPLSYEGSGRKPRKHMCTGGKRLVLVGMNEATTGFYGRLSGGLGAEA
jgi:hypothetical protein